MANIRWKGGAGGSGSWDTGSDWSGNKVPTAQDSVTFAIGGAYTVTGGGDVAALAVNGDSVTFDGIVSVGGAITEAAGSYLTLDQNAQFFAGSLGVAAGSVLEVQGSLFDAFAQVSGIALVDGATATWATSGVVFTDALKVLDGGTFAGDIQLTDGGYVQLDPTANFGGSTLTLAGSGSVFMAANGGAPARGIKETIAFQNAGSVLYLGSDPGTALNLGGPIGNTGNADVYLNITRGNVELSGTSNAYSAGTIVDGSGTLTLDAAGSAGTGAIYLSTGALITDTTQNGRTVIAASGNDSIGGPGGGMVIWAANSTALNVIGGGTGSEVIGNIGPMVSGTLNVIGGSGHDTVYGYNSGNVNFQGGSGGAVVYGGAGVLRAIGGSGGDTIFAGTNGADVLQTGTGPTTLAGGTAGALLIATGSADNLLAAGGGNTTLNGSTAFGNNVMFGASSGNTIIEGGRGDDTIVGTGGADTVYGGTGTENVFAGTGFLQLDFVTTFGGGSTYVSGFQTATDRIHLSGFAPDAVQQALASEQVIGGNTVITLPDNTTIVFWNTTGITAGNFN